MDLFAEEQRIYDNAMVRIEDIHNGAVFDFEEFTLLVKEYGRLLKQLRRATRFADRTTIDLFESNLDLSDKVHYDALTGIYNRRYFEENIKKNIKSLSRSNGMLSIMIVDIDCFKAYNDTYGHGAGDACLRTVAEILLNSIMREDDFVARYGGEEFVIVLPHTDEHGAHIAASRLLNNVIERNIIHKKNEVTDCVTVSIGVTTCRAKHDHKFEDYIKCADEALYKSKQNGRNKYTYVKFKEAEE